MKQREDQRIRKTKSTAAMIEAANERKRINERKRMEQINLEVEAKSKKGSLQIKERSEQQNLKQLKALERRDRMERTHRERMDEEEIKVLE